MPERAFLLAVQCEVSYYCNKLDTFSGTLFQGTMEDKAIVEKRILPVCLSAHYGI